MKQRNTAYVTIDTSRNEYHYKNENFRTKKYEKFFSKINSIFATRDHAHSTYFFRSLKSVSKVQNRPFLVHKRTKKAIKLLLKIFKTRKLLVYQASFTTIYLSGYLLDPIVLLGDDLTPNNFK